MRVIDAETGELAGEWCPVTQREWFKPGTEPTEYSCETEHEDQSWMRDVESEVGDRLVELFKKMVRKRM